VLSLQVPACAAHWMPAWVSIAPCWTCQSVCAAADPLCLTPCCLHAVCTQPTNQQLCHLVMCADCRHNLYVPCKLDMTCAPRCTTQTCSGMLFITCAVARHTRSAVGQTQHGQFHQTHMLQGRYQMLLHACDCTRKESAVSLALHHYCTANMPITNAVSDRQHGISCSSSP
jgi:hypothetical protein